MSEQVEDPRFPESETSRLQQFPAFKQSNNKYTRAFLLGFCDSKVCGKLPPDFDLSTLSELDGASEYKIERQRTSSNPSLSGLLPSNRWNFDLPGERWGHQSFASRSQVTCPSEKRGTKFQPLLGQSGYKAGILVSESPKSDLFQLRKSGNPYRPPHCLKIDDNVKFDSNASLEETDLSEDKGSFLEKLRSVTVEQCETETVDVSVLDKTICVAQENSIEGSDTDQIMGSSSVIDSCNRCFKTIPNNPPHIHLQTNLIEIGGKGVEIKQEGEALYYFIARYDDVPCPFSSTMQKTPQLQDSCSERGMKFIVKPCFTAIGNNQGDSVHCTTEDDDYEFPFSDVENYLNSILGECEASWTTKGGRDYVELGIIKDNECTSDDEWAEISQILQMERVYDHIPNSKIENHLPENLDFNILDNSDAEMNLPDEEALITIDDFIFPPLSTSSIKPNSWEDDALISNLAAKITKNPEALNSPAKSFKVQPFFDVSELVTCRKLHSLKSQSHDILHSKMPYFHPGNDQLNFLKPFTTPTSTHYLPPSLHYRTCSDTNPMPFHGTALTKSKANDSLVHYSMLQQPYICPQQQNQTLVHPACTDLIQKAVAPDFNTTQLIPWTSSDKAIFQDFGKSHSDIESGGFGDKKATSMLNADKFYSGIQYSTTQPGNGISLQQ